jgi:2-polyprenyl-6-methoxyphenol hydroxylase-like FAD-dependent oxidoreductase
MATVVVVGAGVAGLGAALGLAHAGHAVTLVERDGPTGAWSGIDAFSSWDRPHVPQFRQPHTVLARARNLLADRAPQVVERLLADGIEEVNFIRMFAPPEMQRPDDEVFTSFMTRRPAFELALRRTAEDTRGIEFRNDTTATGLVVEERDGFLCVLGVRTDKGDLRGDVVLDAGGRRSPVVRWLRDAGVEIQERVQDCGLTYHSRHFVLRPDADLALPLLALLRFEMRGLTTITFPGEYRTFAICLAPASWDDDLKVLRHNWAWDAAAAAIPALASWVDPANATPIDDVATMAGHRNMLREFVAAGRPVALGLLPVGDALCTTNPANGWGVSMALTTAFAAVDAIDRANGDPLAQALSYDEAVRGEVEDVFLESAALDRLRGYRWQGEEVPPHDRAEAERQALLQELARGAAGDVELGRELLRRVNLLESPRRTLADPDLAERVISRRERRRAERPEPGPARADLVAAVAAATP